MHESAVKLHSFFLHSPLGRKADPLQAGKRRALDTPDGVWERDLGSMARAVFDEGVRGVDPPQEVADPRKFCRTSGGSTLTPLRTPRFYFLAKPD